MTGVKNAENISENRNVQEKTWNKEAGRTTAR
jgi:hypothetical protein